MNIEERINFFDTLFNALESTNSRIEKEYIIDKTFFAVSADIKADWIYILETLDGKHPIGWTFTPYPGEQVKHYFNIRSIIKDLEDVYPKNDMTTFRAERLIGSMIGAFIAPIVNRTLRLGIGKSLLEKKATSPMLAKKYSPQTYLYQDVVVTEKLDGNRCIAQYYDDAWHFTSRNGKDLKVNFNMTGMPTDYIYDGEIMSKEQTLLSIKRYESILTGKDFNVLLSSKDSQIMFNQTSGLINSKGPKAGLVYNVFDIINGQIYSDRRKILDEIDKVKNTDDVRILPILYNGKSGVKIDDLLDKITSFGGEGVMINNSTGLYEHKRTDALLKYKEVKYMDMLVTDVFEGNGKYSGIVGGIECYLMTSDGKIITCSVGSGLSDEQRFTWAIDNSLIIGKIVQIAYHEMTQSKDIIGTDHYSLRFPRLIKVRSDKTDTSEY